MYKVEGFVFQTEEEARDARREAEGIQYIIAQNNMNDPDIVLKLYNGLIQKDVFSTPVGFAFLRRLRAHLNTIPYIRDEDLLPMPVQKTRSESKREDTAPRSAEKQVDVAPGSVAKRENTAPRSRTGGIRNGKRRLRGYRIPFWISTFFAVVFALTLIGMFIITAVSKDNVTILNYENAVIDKYEAWEKELNEREIELQEREIELNERELELQEQEKALEENE